MKNLEQHRQNFPGLGYKVYFNFGGQGIMPNSGLKAILATYEYLEEQGAFSLQANTWITERTNLTKKAIAADLGVTPETITLTENVTAGCNIVLWGINWQVGDHILLTDCEHPGVIAIVKEIGRRFGVEVSTCPIMETLNVGNPVTVIQENLKPNTKLVVLSHLLWNTGQVLPLAEIVEVCHNYQGNNSVQILVDAAQSVGCLPLNLTELGADFYAFTGHKWWCGPSGVGGLYIRPEAFSTINPTFIGWRGVKTDENGQLISWKNDGSKFEVATSAYALYEGLRAAIATHIEWGNAGERYQKICELSKYLWELLSQIEGIKCLKNSAPEAGLVSFQVITGNGSHKKLVENLEKQGFLLRTIADPSCVRACVHYFTLPSEIEQLVTVIKTLI